MISLSNLPQRKNRKTKRTIRGRGYGSGRGGHTVGRGQKGQTSRTGGGKGRFFEGGQNPIYKRLPQYRGFRSNKPKQVVVNLSSLEKKFKNGDTVNWEALVNAGLIKKNEGNVKILANGELTKKLTVAGLEVSENAKIKIEKAGGTVKDAQASTTNTKE